jgi:hypothetical protein
MVAIPGFNHEGAEISIFIIKVNALHTLKA